MLGHIKNLKKGGKSKWWSCFSSSLMKRALNFMRNPKLAHILVANSNAIQQIDSSHGNGAFSRSWLNSLEFMSSVIVTELNSSNFTFRQYLFLVLTRTVWAKILLKPDRRHLRYCRKLQILHKFKHTEECATKSQPYSKSTWLKLNV